MQNDPFKIKIGATSFEVSIPSNYMIPFVGILLLVGTWIWSSLFLFLAACCMFLYTGLAFLSKSFNSLYARRSNYERISLRLQNPSKLCKFYQFLSKLNPHLQNMFAFAGIVIGVLGIGLILL